jgi:hypothetical protein
MGWCKRHSYAKSCGHCLVAAPPNAAGASNAARPTKVDWGVGLLRAELPWPSSSSHDQDELYADFIKISLDIDKASLYCHNTILCAMSTLTRTDAAKS